jgi:hypothetical protein
MRLTRRRLVAGAVVTVLGGVGVERLVDRLIGKPGQSSHNGRRAVEQHLLQGARVVVDDGIEVLVPPLHHRVVTAQVRVAQAPAALGEARHAFESALAELDARYPPSPGGLAATVAWGLPYFRRFVPEQAGREIPVDRRASAARGREIRVVEDAERFPSDPEDTILEHNDVAVLMRSDDPDVIADAQQRLFDEMPDLFAVTSIRTGFVGGGFGGKPSLPKRMATAAGIPGAELVPATAELFLGFTSTVKLGLGPPRIANLETLGYADFPSRYFVGGTHMHLSHIQENLLAWYLNFDQGERVSAMFRPGLEVAPARRTVRQAPDDVETTAELRRDYARLGRIGHAGAIQSASRLGGDILGRDGTLYRKGTAVPQRADFNTLDNPFAWSSDPARDGMKDEPATGVHFVVFNPTSDDFRRVRLAMDGVLPNGARLEFEPRSIGQGVNSVLRTTHRQNFLVPPREHRSFPLSELKA